MTNRTQGLRPRVLVVEDEPDIADLLELHLQDIGAHVHKCGHGREALELATGEPWDLLLLDIRLPGMDGLEVCRRLRSLGNAVPILMLTAKTAELDRVLGLEVGADDYVTKPFSVQEVMARVRAIFRRVELESRRLPATARAVVHDLPGLYIDLEKREVSQSGERIELTAKEFDLLAFFAAHPGKVFRRAQLLDQVWGYGHEGYEHTVNSHINRLRSKIQPHPQDPCFIVTVWGVGYKFDDHRGEPPVVRTSASVS